MKLSSLYLTEDVLDATDEEYFGAIKNFYQDDELVDHIKHGENLARHMAHGDIQTKKSESDNIIVRYIEDENAMIILGFVSKKGKMVKDDVSTLKEWIQHLASAIKDGKIIYTSPNDLSEPILNNVIKRLEKEGIRIEKEEFGGFNFAGKKWINLILRGK